MSNSINTLAQICKGVRGEGPPSLRQSERVLDETQADRYHREKEHRRQIDTIQDDHQPRLLQLQQLLPLPVSTTMLLSLSSAAHSERGAALLPGADPRKTSLAGPVFRGEAGASGCSRSGGVRGGGHLPFMKKLLTSGPHQETLVGKRDDRQSSPPAFVGNGVSQYKPPAHEGARAVGEVPYPTMRSLRKI